MRHKKWASSCHIKVQFGDFFRAYVYVYGLTAFLPSLNKTFTHLLCSNQFASLACSAMGCLVESTTAPPGLGHKVHLWRIFDNARDCIYHSTVRLGWRRVLMLWDWSADTVILSSGPRVYHLTDGCDVSSSIWVPATISNVGSMRTYQKTKFMGKKTRNISKSNASAPSSYKFTTHFQLDSELRTDITWSS